MSARRTPSPAKISRPRLYGASPRTRLFARLDELRARPLIWVAGPPGAGKTTLVASYLEARGLTGLWLQVDRADADPATFFYFLGLAARRAGQGGNPLPLLRPEYLSDIDGFARRFFRMVFKRIGEAGVLVIDNFQEVPEESGFARLLELACEQIPRGSNLIVLSRQDEPAEFARTQANSLVGRLGWEDLRITQDEAALIARTRQAVSEPMIERLHAECDGWAAGLTLMLDRLQRTGNMPESTGAESRETVFNYFASQILEQAAPREQQTLCISALLPEMTARSVHDLASDPHAGSLLESLYRRHLFTYRREGAEPVFQYHALFRAFLLSRMNEFSEKEKSALRHRAAALLEKEGMADGAISLYIEGAEIEAAIRLVLSHAAELMAQGRSQTLAVWIITLPERRLEEEPWLRYWLGVAQLAAIPEQAQQTLTKADKGFESRNDVTGRIMVASAILHAFYISYARFSPAKEWITLLSDLLKSAHALPSKGAEIQANAVMLLANLYRHALPAEVEFWVGNVERLLQDEAPAGDKLMAGIALLSYTMVAGRADVGHRSLQLLCSLEERPEINEPILIMWLIRKADFLHHILDLQSAIDAARQARKLAREHGQRYAQLFACFVEGQALLKAFDFREAERLDEEMRLLCDGTRRIEVLHACGNLPFRHVYCANHESAVRDGQVAFDVAKATRVPYFIAVWSTPVVCGYAGTGHYAKALRTLEETRAALAGTVCQDAFETVSLIIEAYCAIKTGDVEGATKLTRKALGLAREFGREAFLRWTGPLLAPLLQEVLRTHSDSEQARRIIRRLELAPPENRMDPDWEWEIRVHTLGGFEITKDGAPMVFSGKLPKKSLALLKLLVARGPGDVPEQQILDALWPDEEGDAGEKALSVTLLRLRRLLGDNDLIRHQGGKLSLDSQRCWVDAFAFEHMLSALPNSGTGSEENWKSLEQALSSYRGTFLPEDSEEPWTVSVRERLRAKFVHALVALGRNLEASGRFDEAIGWYLKGLDADPIVETFYQGLMRCYGKLDRRTESIAAYRRLRQTLSITLGLQPSTATEKLYQSIREGA
jgi:LuxR family maltose regulon positive regulatory protein